MAKTKEEIKELLATHLFIEGQKSNYISISEKGDITYIEYHCKNGAKRKLQNPEEFVQATVFLRLIMEYNYSPLNISVNEEVQVGSSRKEADLLVYNDNNTKILIVVECKEEQINERQFQIAIDQAYAYAHALAGQYVWVTSGIRNEYFEIVELYPVERISISDIPFNGPIAGVNVGLIDGEFTVNASPEDMKRSEINLEVAGTKYAINMVEADAKEVDEETMLKALMFGHERIKELIAFEEKIVEAVGKEKMEIPLFELDQNIVDEVTAITDEKIRPDGRQVDEIRPLNAQVDLLPRVHGSALFTRGETQVMSIVTLGALGDAQKIDGLGDDADVTWMHHYNFPPYCVGEVGRMGAPGRREIGHGALGERAIRQVMPSTADFPYTVRAVAEVLESNGSSSQASICASTMALMAAGVPIKAPVAGVAMGLVKKGDNYTILTDIQGMEDHLGDMDFKVAGTEKGICALQMDIKIDGITEDILREALAQAKGARKQIMDVMLAAIPAPRDHLSEYAPKYATMHIDVEQIKDVIGKGGEMINKIIEECDNVKIDIDEEGNVAIYHHNQEAIDKAIQYIEKITKKAKVGEIYDGKAVRVEDKYAFIELFEGTNGFLHVKDVAWDRTDKVSDVIKLGDIVKVKVTQITDKGVNVSRKVLLPRPVAKKEDKKDENSILPLMLLLLMKCLILIYQSRQGLKP